MIERKRKAERNPIGDKQRGNKKFRQSDRYMDKQTEYRERGAERCSDSEPERQTHREKNRQ